MSLNALGSFEHKKLNVALMGEDGKNLDDLDHMDGNLQEL